MESVLIIKIIVLDVRKERTQYVLSFKIFIPILFDIFQE